MTVHLVVQLASGRRPELGLAARAAVPRILPLLGWSLLAGLLMLIGLCACVIPFFYLLGVFTVLAPVVMFERGPAIARCFTLFRGDVGASAARVAIILGFSVGVSVLSQVVGASVAGIAGTDIGARMVAAVAAATVAALLRAAVGVLTAPLTVLTYADERARIEPVRSADLIAALGLGPAGGQSSATVPA